MIGPTSIKEFTLTLMCGLVCGAYSSVCITGPIWYLMSKRSAQAKVKKAEEARENRKNKNKNKKNKKK